MFGLFLRILKELFIFPLLSLDFVNPISSFFFFLLLFFLIFLQINNDKQNVNYKL